MESRYSPSPLCFNVPKKKFYVKLPYFGFQSEKMKREISRTLSRFYPFVEFRIILTNDFRIGSLFNYKDRLPKTLQSGLIYQFSCVASPTSPSTYIGNTSRHLYVRFSEHSGNSFRTGLPLTKTNSEIFKHSTICKCQIDFDNFKILSRSNSPNDLRVLESLYIFKLKPNLNNADSSIPLNIVK